MRASGYLVLFMLLPGLASPAEIFRCQGASGEPEFRQRPCGESTMPLPLPRDAPPATGLRASERAWLAAREQGPRRDVQKPRRAGRSEARDAQSAARRDYQCRRRQRQLEEVRADLRRGYAPARGERLRRRQRAHEDYLSAFCP
jgi:hypothetical protein